MIATSAGTKVVRELHRQHGVEAKARARMLAEMADAILADCGGPAPGAIPRGIWRRSGLRFLAAQQGSRVRATSGRCPITSRRSAPTASCGTRPGDSRPANERASPRLQAAPTRPDPSATILSPARDSLRGQGGSMAVSPALRRMTERFPLTAWCNAWPLGRFHDKQHRCARSVVAREGYGAAPIRGGVSSEGVGVCGRRSGGCTTRRAG
jgi:hypothetical protein